MSKDRFNRIKFQALSEMHNLQAEKEIKREPLAGGNDFDFEESFTPRASTSTTSHPRRSPSPCFDQNVGRRPLPQIIREIEKPSVICVFHFESWRFGLEVIYIKIVEIFLVNFGQNYYFVVQIASTHLIMCACLNIYSYDLMHFRKPEFCVVSCESSRWREIPIPTNRRLAFSLIRTLCRGENSSPEKFGFSNRTTRPPDLSSV